MAETKKLTKRDYFSKLRNIVIDNAELVAFIDHEVELLDKKNSSKGQTKTQVANESLKDEIVKALAEIGTGVTISELQNANPKMGEYSNQKLSALLNQLVDVQRVIKVTDKKKSYFSVAE